MKAKNVIIIDYQMSNLYSVIRAIENVGHRPKISSEPEEILNADALILPGVGAFGSAMKNLRELHLVDSIRSYISKGRPFMGVCLGLQLLFERSEEFGENNGLGIIKGDVKKFENSHHNEPVPQIGWNKIYPLSIDWRTTPFKGTQEGSWMYFVHSYYVNPIETSLILSETEYCKIKYCSSIQHENILATQFHPEKSGERGLEIYKNWLK